MRRWHGLLLLPTILICWAIHTLAQDAFAGDLLNRINTQRIASGIPALLANTALVQAAQRHSDDMAATQQLSHTGSDGSLFWQRMQAAGYLLTAGAENILVQPRPDAGAALSLWLDSPPHRENLLNPTYAEAGIAYAQAADGSVYVTLVLGLREGVTPPPLPSLLPTLAPTPTATATPLPPPTATPPPTFTPFGQPGDITRTQIATRTAQMPAAPTLMPDATRTLAGTATSTPAAGAGSAAAQVLQNTFENFSAGLWRGEIIASTTPTLTPAPPPSATPVLPADVRLIYDADVLTLINISGRLIDLSRLRFESASGSFAAERWNNPQLSQPLTEFTPDDCLQIWGVGTLVIPQPPAACGTRHAWAAVGDAAHFWRNINVFVVLQGDDAIGVCATAAGQCDLSLSRRIPLPTLAAPTSPPADADLRLLYDSLQLTLINIAGRPLDLGRLIFTSESGTISIERWNSKALTRSLYSFTSGDCLQTFIYGYDVTQPYTSACAIRHGWFVAGEDEDFWRGAATFAVNRDGIRVGLCSVAQGQCDVSLDDNLGAAIQTPAPNATPTPAGADVRLLLSPAGVALINISGRDLDLRPLVFTSDTASFAAIRWASQPLSRPLSQFTGGDCLHVWAVGSAYQERPAGCFVRHGWIVVPPAEQFWANTSSFRVESFGNVLATCQVSAGVCDFSLLPERG